ncbi:MAG: murein biosynthesis integral membrane protein MurJ [Candidatus Omnitrophica bacterium]|nr:murein biosynthesis integral membrane protein MurJ [Candidatus Omnitrophota bacterium]
MSKKSLLRSTGVIGFATATSRVLGFIRDIVIAGFFGTAMFAQAFVIAFRIPNLLRDLVGEGATNSAFVPVLTDELTKKGKQDFFKLAQVILNIMFWALLILTVLGVLLSPLIVRLIAPGFSADVEKFEITVKLTRILFPFLFLVGLWAYAMGVLNSLGYFAAPAFGPSIMNLSMILCAVWFGENIFGLAAGVLAGGFFQLAIQFPSLYAAGWKARLTNDFTHPKAHKIGILLVPRALGACVYQVNVFVSTILASLSGIVGEGAVAALYYANRVWQLPLAIFGIALAQAALPMMSRHVALNEKDKLKDTLRFSLNILFFILIPSSIGLAVMREPITKVLFERGAFTAYSTGITSIALLYYAIGLVACGGVKILVNTFYSMHDTMTPVKTALAALVLNVILNLALMFPMKLGGLALATSISAVFNFCALYIMLARRIGQLDTRAMIDSFVRVTLAGVVMGIVLMFLMIRVANFTFVSLAFAIVTGIFVFLSASYLFEVREMKDLITWISKRK